MRIRSGPSTREALVRAAYDLFTQLGYAEVSVGKIAKAAGHTEGALFHHFKNKNDIYRLVVNQVHRQFQKQLAEESVKENDPLESLLQRVKLSLRLPSQSKWSHKILQEAPFYLGYEEWRKISTDAALTSIEPQLRMIMGDNNISQKEIRLMAYIILGIMNEFCSAQMHGSDDITEDDMVDAVERVVLAWVSN